MLQHQNSKSPHQGDIWQALNDQSKKGSYVIKGQHFEKNRIDRSQLIFIENKTPKLKTF